jgi:ABC-type glycerol-3-phosphate transport system substrate-binding protein
MATEKRSRRDFLKAAAGTAAAGVAAASGLEAGVKTAEAAAPAVQAAAVEPTGVLWGLNYAPHILIANSLIKLFKQKYGSTITLQPQANPGGSVLIAAIAAGTQPDLVIANASGLVALALQGALTTLNNSVYAYNHIDIARDFVGDAVQAFTFNGSIWGVPCETDGGIAGNINVPVDAVEKAGVEKLYPPTNGQIYFESYDQLYALAKALQITVHGKVKRWGLCGEGWDLATMAGQMLTMGMPIFNAATETFNFNTPVGIRAMQLHVENPVKMGIEREWNDEQAVIDEALNGNAAVTMGNAVPVFYGHKYGYDYQGTGYPKIDGKIPRNAGAAAGWGLVGPIRVQHPNLQLAFLRMMGTEDGQFAYDVAAGNPVPAWKNLLLHPRPGQYQYLDANGLTFLKNVANSSWWQNGLLNCEFIGPVGYSNRVEQALDAACQSVRAGKMGSAAAMAQLQQAAEAQYAQYKRDLANLE